MFQPLHMMLTIVLDPKDDKTEGGIIKPDAYGDAFATGVVRTISPLIQKNKEEHSNLSPGSRVLINQHMERHPAGGQRAVPFPTLEDDGITITLCNIGDVLGIIDDATT